MRHALSNLHCAATALLLAICSAASAQTAAPVPDAPRAAGRSERPQKATERLHTEDAGSRIDEVRVGGETQSITVQPKTGTNVPAYEVRPSDSTKGSAPGSSSSGTTGSRVWNVLKF
jgi:starvation-inducible outer membrane lipoprotein